MTPSAHANKCKALERVDPGGALCLSLKLPAKCLMPTRVISPPIETY
jgi:hypothetical protein